MVPQTQSTICWAEEKERAFAVYLHHSRCKRIEDLVDEIVFPELLKAVSTNCALLYYLKEKVREKKESCWRECCQLLVDAD